MCGRLEQFFSDYRLLRFLGGGGSAEVYLAEHLQFKTLMAIKVLFGRMRARETQIFMQEAQMIAAVHHPHIINLFDFGVQDGTPFLVMDYAPNGSLADRHLLHTILPLSLVLSYLKQIGEALQFAHEQHFIHRNLKPENILIGYQNELLLSDFGMANMTHSATSLKAQTIVSTTSYMAPEQILGNPCQASDQYALASIIYRWLCGRPPFTGSAMEIVTQHLSAMPPPPQTYNTALSPDIAGVLCKALAKEPGQRFTNISTFVQALEQASKDIQQNHEAALLAQVSVSKTDNLSSQPLSTEQALSPDKETTIDSVQAVEYIYTCLREQVHKQVEYSSYGAVVVRTEKQQIGQMVHMLEEDEWLKDPQKRVSKTSSVCIQKYMVKGHDITAAIFYRLPGNEYMTWVDEHEPVPVSIHDGSVAYVDLRATTTLARESTTLASRAMDSVYAKLCKQTTPTYTWCGGLVVRVENDQVNCAVYALKEASWIKYPRNSNLLVTVTYAQQYTIGKHTITAAVFQSLSDDVHILWIDGHKPIVVPIRQGQTTLVDLRDKD